MHLIDPFGIDRKKHLLLFGQRQLDAETATRRRVNHQFDLANIVNGDASVGELQRGLPKLQPPLQPNIHALLRWDLHLIPLPRCLPVRALVLQPNRRGQTARLPHFARLAGRA